ncbi:hypothetical protein CR970_00895 [Candidatus Saccharibacteria bacterium]|nr:MAG: hypothetical protein CR970_00895 [Candidatus Saccharibacteria bacterium]
MRTATIHGVLSLPEWELAAERNNEPGAPELDLCAPLLARASAALDGCQADGLVQNVRRHSPRAPFIPEQSISVCVGNVAEAYNEAGRNGKLTSCLGALAVGGDVIAKSGEGSTGGSWWLKITGAGEKIDALSRSVTTEVAGPLAYQYQKLRAVRPLGICLASFEYAECDGVFDAMQERLAAACKLDDACKGADTVRLLPSVRIGGGNSGYHSDGAVELAASGIRSVKPNDLDPEDQHGIRRNGAATAGAVADAWWNY